MTYPSIDPLLRACGLLSDREQARKAIFEAHEAMRRSLNARSRRAQLKNGHNAMAALNTALRVLPAQPVDKATIP